MARSTANPASPSAGGEVELPRPAPAAPVAGGEVPPTDHRRAIRVEVSEHGDGGFAVVDVDTLWRHRETGEPFHWRGRACKGYTRLAGGEWKLILHTGLLDYGE